METGYNYPLLNQIAAHFSKQEMKKVHICACQHILEPQEMMFDLICKSGILSQHVHILGKIYSTNLEVLGELQKSGYNAIQPVFDSTRTFDEQHRDNCRNLYESFIKTVKNSDRVIVIDDGAELLNTFNDSVNESQHISRIVGIEQTSSGFRKLENKKLNFPIINVARSGIKLDKESPLIARLGCDRIKDVIKKYKISEPRILVAGLGPIGNNVQMILKEEEFAVFGHDTAFDSKSEIVELILKNNINILIGATGKNILTEQQTVLISEKMVGKIYLISMSSSDREFPASFLRQERKQDTGTHDDTFWKNLILINNGFPITFKGKRYESTPLEIEKTVALLYGSVLYAARHELMNPGFMDVPGEINSIIQEYESN